MESVLRRFYTARPLSAALLCLPGILLCLWYAWEAFAGFDRYRKMVGSDIPISIEDFQIQLYDALSRDRRRMAMPSSSGSKLKTFSFHISPDNLTRLIDSAPLDTGRPYVAAKLERGRKLKKIEVRLRGQRHWHKLGRQKSLKVRLPKGELVGGYRIFNLINDPTPLVVGEQIILEIARKKGVLTPKSSFVRVAINGSDIGVFRFEAQPDESLLRSNGRVPGSIYSGNLSGSAKTEELWNGPHRWRKSAWRIDPEEHDFSDLEAFLKNLRSMSVRDFTAFARSEMDLKAFATFDALDVAFGGDQHDYRQNHKLHYDPYRGLWEPVAWNFRGFKHDPRFNLVENPILLRLKTVPEYLSTRNRILHDLLADALSVSAVRSRGRKLLKRLAPDLASDRFFDAYKLLPRIDRFHRQMVRPMNLKRAALVFESEMVTYERRHAFLMRALKKNPLRIHMGAPVTDGQPWQYRIPLDIILDGKAGVQVRDFQLAWPETCKEVRFQVFDGDAPLTGPSSGIQGEVLHPIELLPRTRSSAFDESSDKRGEVLVDTTPTRFDFTLYAMCLPTEVAIQGIHLATGSWVRSRPVDSTAVQQVVPSTLGPDDTPRFVPKEISPVPGEWGTPHTETIQLGPGTVSIPITQVWKAHQLVEVAPGTRFEMGADASLIFLGQVMFRGTRDQKIVIEGQGGESWGGIALQGPGTRGSLMQHVTVRQGTTPKYKMIPYPGTINIHDTKDITIAHCRLSDNSLADDFVHTAYLKNLTIEHTEVSDAFFDAFDLEFTSSSLRNITAKRVGDDALDLMGCDVSLADSVFIDCGGYGVSAGEETHIRILDTLVAESKAGVLAKNASEVDLAGSLFFNNAIGLRVYQQTTRYAGASRIASNVTYIVGSKKAIKRDDASKNALDLGRIQRRLPMDGSLDHLFENVLGLSNAKALGDFVAAAKGKER